MLLAPWRRVKLYVCSHRPTALTRTYARLRLPCVFACIFLVSFRTRTRDASASVHFLTFASSDIDLSQLREEASFFRFRSERFYNESSLHGTAFWLQHKNFIQSNRRGYGYWIWKPFFILERLRQLPEDEVLLYADGGCSLNYEGAVRLQEYITRASSNRGLLLFHLPLDEEVYSKRDCVERILPNVSPEDLGKQRIATTMLIVNSNSTKIFFEEVLNISKENNYHYLDDSQSRGGESTIFIDHRHDQSIISLLSKKHGYSSIPDETYPPKKAISLRAPVIASRRKPQKNIN